MELKDAILTRRSVRKFTDEPVTPAQLEQVIALAAYAPSWKNTQISRYLAITSCEKKQEISDRFCTLSGTNNAQIIANAPVLIAQSFVKNRSGYERDGTFTTDRCDGWQHYDCGLAAQTLCLAAHDLGLATVIMGVFERKGLQEYLNLPQEQELIALIAIGHPQGAWPAPKRKEVSALLSYL